MVQEIEKVARLSLLVDFYGQLLTDKQRQAMELHYGEDLSLGEIAESLEISRQAVHDLVKRSTNILEDYEASLGLVAKHLRTQQELNQARQYLRQYRQNRDDSLLDQAEKLLGEVINNF